MSSAPAGIDVREYAYGMFRFTTPDVVTYQFTTTNKWLVTRIQAFAPSTGQVWLTTQGGSSIPIAADSCVTLEPNGAHRGTVLFGDGPVGALIIIEFWYQARPNGVPPAVVVTP